LREFGVEILLFKKVFKEAEVGEEVIVMAWVYLTRLMSVSAIRLAASNWKLMILSCFMLASKGDALKIVVVHS
jgi:hypothetical protein